MSDHRLVRGTFTASGAPCGTVDTCIERAAPSVIAGSFADLLRLYVTRAQFTRFTIVIEEA